jgi:predicted ATPase
MADQIGDPGLRATALSIVGSCAAVDGAYVEARTLLESALSVYDPEKHRTQCFVYGQDAKVGSCATLGWALWPMGYPERALAMADEGLSWAEELKHAGSIALARMYRMLVRYEHADVAGVTSDVEALTDLATRHGLAGQVVYAGILGAWTRNDVETARAFLAGLEASGAELALSIYSVIVARIEAASGLHDAALERLERAMERAHRVKELFYVPVIGRLQGLFLLARDPGAHEAAEEHLRRALAFAHGQQARMQELEAATALARLLHAHGRGDEARALLAPIHGFFTEGFDTVQLVEARALMDQLALTREQGD